MHVEVRPAARSVVLRPDPASPPAFDILTTENAYVVLEVATSPDLFEAATPPQDPARYARIETDAVTPGAARGHLRTRLPSGVTPASGGPAVDGKGAVVRPAVRVPVPPDVWKQLLAAKRIYYRALASTDEKMQRPDSSYLRPVAFRKDMYSWAPFVEILRDNVTRCYRRDGGTPSRRPWLTRSGNTVVVGRRDKVESTDPVRLCGINVDGLEHRLIQYQRPVQAPDGSYCPATTWRQAAEISRARLELIRSWGATVIRLPINQQWAVNGRAQSGRSADRMREEYLASIDEVVDLCASLNMYVLLDLQVIDNLEEILRKQDAPTLQYQPVVPDNLSLVMWAMLASRYQNEPNVLYDLCNEPHTPRNDGDAKDVYWYCGPAIAAQGDGAADAKWAGLWKEWVVLLEEVIHGIHPDALLFVSGFGGPAFSSDLRMMPVTVTRNGKEEALPNIVYSAHFYPREGLGTKASAGAGVATPPGTPTTTAQQPTVSERTAMWDTYLGTVRNDHPIFLGEWGPLEPDADQPGDWIDSLAAYLVVALTGEPGRRPAGIAGWTAWSWGASPNLFADEKVAPSCSDFDGRKPSAKPTRWGTVLQNTLRTTMSVAATRVSP